MPIPVADEEVDEPGRQELAGIHEVLGALVELLEQLGGAGDLARALEAGNARILLRGPFLEQAERAPVALPILAEPRVVREPDESRFDVENAGRFEELGHDE